MDPEIRSFLIEQWIEYGIILLLLLLRLATRIRLRGFGLQGDDYLTILGIVIITIMSVAAMGVSSNGHNRVPQTEEQRRIIFTETPEVAAQLATGSQWFLVGWFTYPGFMWCMKLSMLFLLKRLTENTVAAKFVLPVMCFTVMCYVIHCIVVLTYCMPFHKYWQVYPDPGYRCYPDTLILYIVCLIFNVLTDFMIAAIPVPLMFQVRMSIWRKIGTSILLSASAFIVVASILRVYFSITSDSGAAPAVWACRETLVAAFIVTTPVLIPMLKRSFWTKGPVSSDGTRSGGNNSRPIQLSDNMSKSFGNKSKNRDNAFMEYGEAGAHVGSSSSTEHINRPEDGKVLVTHNVTVNEERWNGSDSKSGYS